MNKLKFKSAFTLIELIFAIVIFAIISMFGADLYTKIYDSYIQTRSMNQLQSRTENTLSLITSRLEDRIRGTVIGRDHRDRTYVPIDSILETHDILEWLGQSVETRNLPGKKGAADSVGWSGFVDMGSISNFVSATDKEGASFKFTTVGSKLSEMGEVLKNIKGNQKFGLVFRGAPADSALARAYGYDGENADKVAQAAIDADNVISVTNYQGESSGRIFYSEQYYLTHSAYAIVPVPSDGKVHLQGNDGVLHPQGGRVFDLELRYNYETWNGQSYDNEKVSRAVIAKDVSLFRFKDDNGALAIKLCMRDNGRNFDPAKLDLIVCKSQVVY